MPASRESAVEGCVEQRTRELRVYDAAVAIVSCWETLCTRSENFPAVVRHFERFPRIPMVGGNPCTPDFTLLLNRGTGVVFEIAHLAHHESSADSICRQLANYALLENIQGPDGLTAVGQLDVVLLVPFGSGSEAVQRVIRERMLNEAHAYAPPRAPIIVEYMEEPVTGRYVFSRMGHPENGDFDDASMPEQVRLSHWFRTGSFKMFPKLFASLKADRPLMNDEPPDLYLATLLWMRLLPQFKTADENIRLSHDEIMSAFEAKFGKLKRATMRRTLTALEGIGLAQRQEDGIWIFPWHELPTRADGELVQALAERLCRRQVPRAPRSGPPEPEQTALFE